MVAFLLLTRLIFKSEKTKIFANLLFALNPVLIWYSQEARSYSMLLTFALFALYFTLKIKKDKKLNSINSAGLIISTLLGLYTHNLFVFIAFVNFILFINFRKFDKAFIKILLMHCAVGLLYLPWLIIMLGQFGTVSEEGFWLKLSPIKSVVVFLGQIFTGDAYSDRLNWLGTFSLLSLWFFAVPLLLYSFYRIFKNKNQGIAQISKWFILLAALIWLYSFKTSFFYIRYLIFLIPPAIILVSFSLANIHKRFKYIGKILVLVLIFSTAIISINQSINVKNQKANMRELIQGIEYQESDLILHSNAYTHHAFNIYADLPNLIYNPEDDLPYYEGLAVVEEGDYYRNKKTDRYERVWVIYLWRGKERVSGELEQNHHLVKSNHYEGDLHLDLWKK